VTPRVLKLESPDSPPYSYLLEGCNPIFFSFLSVLFTFWIIIQLQFQFCSIFLSFSFRFSFNNYFSVSVLFSFSFSFAAQYFRRQHTFIYSIYVLDKGSGVQCGAADKFSVYSLMISSQVRDKVGGILASNLFVTRLVIGIATGNKAFTFVSNGIVHKVVPHCTFTFPTTLYFTTHIYCKI